MVQINFAQKSVTVKIVYYGPGMSGKTTNLEVIHQRAPDQSRGELTSISTDGDRTLFFDFMPLDLGTVAGMRTQFQIYTVPGQVYYNSTRKLVLQGVDGVIFVADSSASMVEENQESMRNLAENLADYGKDLAEMPMVIQYNKRDLPDALTVEELDATLNPGGVPTIEGVASSGQGVFPTLKSLAALVLDTVHKASGVNSSTEPTKSEPLVSGPVQARVPAPVQASVPAPSQASVPAPSEAVESPVDEAVDDEFAVPKEPTLAPPTSGSTGFPPPFPPTPSSPASQPVPSSQSSTDAPPSSPLRLVSDGPSPMGSGPRIAAEHSRDSVADTGPRTPASGPSMAPPSMAPPSMAPPSMAPATAPMAAEFPVPASSDPVVQAQVDQGGMEQSDPPASPLRMASSIEPESMPEVPAVQAQEQQSTSSLALKFEPLVPPVESAPVSKRSAMMQVPADQPTPAPSPRRVANMNPPTRIRPRAQVAATPVQRFSKKTVALAVACITAALGAGMVLGGLLFQAM